MNASPPLVRHISALAERLPDVSLDPHELERYAAKAEGILRVPGEHWRPSLEALCADLAGPAALHRLGRIIACGQLVGVLRQRIRARRLLEREPAIAAEPIERPVIIMGQMRSGTTRLQRLLACDPRFAATRLFETLHPVPTRGRVAKAWAVSGVLRTLNRENQRIHPIGPLRPEEEFGYLSLALHGAQFEVEWDVPTFASLQRGRSMAPVYAEFAAILRMNGWARGGIGGRHWLLKCPAYTSDAAAIIEAFPDARLLCLERDPVSVVASSASLVWNHRRVHSDAADRVAIGAEWLEKTRWRRDRLSAARAAAPHVPALDLDYDAITEDWQTEIARVYAFLDMDWPDKVRAAQARYLGRARAHRGHRYRLSDYGLDEARVRSAFCADDTPSVVGELAAVV